MKLLISTATAALVAFTFAVPAQAFDAAVVTGVSTAALVSVDAPQDAIDRRGRGGRSKTRIPGGSGCDDPEDILEHPECSG